MADTASLIIKVDATGVKKATEELEGLGYRAKLVDNTTKKTGNAISNLGRNAGQAGIQVQQFVGQLQGGQSAMLALSQQGADLGFVLGAPLVGAIIGIGASLIGMSTGIGQSASAMDRLEKAASALSGTLKVDNGVVKFTEDIKRLAQESERAATLLLLTAQEQSKRAGQAAAEGVAEVFNDTFDVTFLQSSFDSLVKVAGTAQGTGYTLSQEYKEIGEQLGFTGKEAREAGVSILVSLRDMQEAITSGTPEAAGQIVNFQEKLSGLIETATGARKEKLLEFAIGIQEYLDKAKQAAIVAKELGDGLKKIGSGDSGVSDIVNDQERLRLELQASQALYKAIPDSIAQYESSLSSVSAQIEYQTIAIRDGAKAAYEYQVAQRLGLESAEQIPEKQQAEIDKLYELIEAKKQLKTTQEELKLSAQEMYQSIAENTVRGLGDAAATAIVEMKSLGDGVKGVLQGALKQAISTLIQLGAQELIFAKTKATARGIETAAAVKSGGAIATAMTPAATATTVATGGANLTTAQSLMPTYIGAFLAMMAATSAVGRQSGGSLQGGQSSYIAENGIEIFTPNRAGRVFNSDEVAEMIRGGGSGNQIAVNINASGENFDQWLDNGGIDKIKRKLNQAELL